MWVFQVSCSFSTIPRKINSLTSSISIWSILSFGYMTHFWGLNDLYSCIILFVLWFKNYCHICNSATVYFSLTLTVLDITHAVHWIDKRGKIVYITSIASLCPGIQDTHRLLHSKHNQLLPFNNRHHYLSNCLPATNLTNSLLSV